MNVTSEPLTSTISSEKDANQLWLDIFLPITVFGILVLFLVICYGSLLKVYSCCRKCKQRRSNRSRAVASRTGSTSNQGRENPRFECDNGDLYSIANQPEQTEIPDFEVVVEDSTFSLPSRIPDVSQQEKSVYVLPTYDEFISGKFKNANKKDSPKSIEQSYDQNEELSSSFNDNQDNLVTDSIIASQPPPYTEND